MPIIYHCYIKIKLHYGGVAGYSIRYVTYFSKCNEHQLLLLPYVITHNDITNTTRARMSNGGDLGKIILL